MSDANMNLSTDVRRRVEQHLDALEQTLAGSGMSREERRSVADDVQGQIVEMLAARAPNGATVADVEAVLAELDPPEAYHGDAARATPAVAAVAAVVPARFSRTAIVGAVWAGLFLFALVAFFSASLKVVDHHSGDQPPPGPSVIAMIGIAAGIVGLAAPIGTTACGLAAISQIRASLGRLCGLPLAVCDALLFPLLILDGVICWGAVAIYETYRVDLGQQGRSNLAIALICIAIVLIVAADFLIGRAVWRAASRPNPQGSAI